MDGMLAIGLMSGTSCDGVDVVMLWLEDPDRRHEPEVVHHAYFSYPKALREELIDPLRLTLPRVAELHIELASVYADAIQSVPAYESASCCGVHGQTSASERGRCRSSCRTAVSSPRATMSLRQWPSLLREHSGGCRARFHG